MHLAKFQYNVCQEIIVSHIFHMAELSSTLPLHKYVERTELIAHCAVKTQQSTMPKLHNNSLPLVVVNSQWCIIELISKMKQKLIWLW
jgi:hypothetical protein